MTSLSITPSSVPNSALSVGGLTDYLQMLLEEDDQLRHVWVTGEVSSTNRHKSGLFFTLRDPDREAAIDAVVWTNRLSELATLPQKGEQVIVLASLRLYPKRGSYSLTVWQVLPAGDGLRALRDRQLYARLEAEGLFDRDRKRPLPFYPRTIAVVTSPQAAAWGDVQRTLRQRHPGLHVLLSPAQVQGDVAPKSIVQAIERVVRDGRAEVLLLTRGGGATEDLSCFNDEQVVRAIATCPVPVLTGIGHERDESLADLVADARAHTPTAAAAEVIPYLADLQELQRSQVQRLQHQVQNRLTALQTHHEHLRLRLQRHHPQRQLQHQQATLQWQRQHLRQLVQQRLTGAQQRHQQLQEMLTALDPSQILRRGYAVVRDCHQVLRSVQTVTPGQDLTIQLSDGRVAVTVTTVTPDAPPPVPDGQASG